MSPIPSEPRTTNPLYHAAAPTHLAMSFTAMAIGAIYLVQLIAAQLISTSGAFLISFGAAATGVVWGAKKRAFRLGATPAPARFWIAATLIGSSTWCVGLALVSWLEPPGDPGHLELVVKRLPLATALLGLAILPALAEELVFRGVLARALARRSTALAIVGSALVFSLYHLLPIQVVATMPLGIALAILAVRSDSILPGMLAHALNNALVIALARNAAPWLSSAIEEHPGVAMAIAMASTATGIGLAIRKPDHQLAHN